MDSGTIIFLTLVGVAVSGVGVAAIVVGAKIILSILI